MNKIYFCSILACFFLMACDAPIHNTPEYLEAHEVIEGQTNSISVEGVNFTIPSKYRINVYTAGKIIPHQADELTVYFEFPELLKDSTSNSSRVQFTVRTELRYMGVVRHDGMNLFETNHREWDEITNIKGLGLTRFKDHERGGWGYISFQSDEKILSVPFKRPVVFRCAGYQDKYSLCKGSNQYSNGIHSWFFIPNDLMPEWREVFDKIDSELKLFMKVNG